MTNLPPNDTLAQGTVLMGRYRLDAVLGEGGMAIVYRAFDQQLGRPVALKLIRSNMRQQVERFKREALATAALVHPAVVRVYGLGAAPDGRPFLILEFVPGEDLGHVLAREGRMEPYESVALLARVVGAVVEAHAAGISHRDIKPGNLIIQPVLGGGPMLRLVDFGIATLQDMSGPRLTASGQFVGTPEFMAPEQAVGAITTSAVDVWATGVMLQRMLTGTAPFLGANTPEVLYRVVNDAPQPCPSWVPHRLVEIIESCLQKDPVLRPTSAELLGKLEAYLATVEEAQFEDAGEEPHKVWAPAPSERVVLLAPPRARHLTGEPPPVDGEALLSEETTEAGASDLEALVGPLEVPPKEPPVLVTRRGGVLSLAVGLLLGLGIAAAALYGTGRLNLALEGTVETPPAPIEVAVGMLEAGAGKAASKWLKKNAPARPSARWQLMTALADMRAGYIARSVPPITALLDANPALAREPIVLEVVLRSLRFEGGESAVALLEKGPLADIGWQTVTELISDKNKLVRWRAARLVGARGGDGPAALRAALAVDLKQATRCDTRKKAIEKLIAMADPKVLPMLRAETDRPKNKCLESVLADGIERISQL